MCMPVKQRRKRQVTRKASIKSAEARGIENEREEQQQEVSSSYISQVEQPYASSATPSKGHDVMNGSIA